MFKLPPPPAFAIAALLAACATPQPPGPDAPPAPGPGATRPAAERPAPTPAAKTPAFDWTAARTRLATTLDGGTDVTVSVREDGTLHLLVPGADAFARDQADPSPALAATLDRIAEALVQVPQTRVHVFGHTDSLGRELYNLQLSIRRAESVAEHLRVRGVSLVRLTADGHGEAEPIADNATETGRARNRRVEIIVLPPE